MNNWLDKLERKFSRYAIPNLITYIIILYAAGFALELINPTFYSQFLSLDASKILQGQIWRIVTFIIQPPSDSLIFIAFAALYPDIQLLLFFVIPIKIKWLAILDGLYFIYAIVQAFLPAYGGGVFGIYYKANALAAFISILNFIIFFLLFR